jgi:pimeloyl-ACP methyl ester carboxylesterase
VGPRGRPPRHRSLDELHLYAPPYFAVDPVEDTVGVLDAHGIEGAQNWGVSLGGMISQQLPINHLDHLHTGTIMSSTPEGNRGRRDSWRYTLPTAGPTSVVMELIEGLSGPGRGIEAWVTEDRMLYGTYTFDEAEAVRSQRSSSAGASNILSPLSSPGGI